MFEEMIRNIYATAKTYKKKSRKVKNSTIKAPVRSKKKFKGKIVTQTDSNEALADCWQDQA